MGGTVNPLPFRGSLSASVVVACIVLFISDASAQESEWSVGLSAVKITPRNPVRLAGYAARIKPSESTEQDIFATAMALQDAQNHRAVLVTLDLCTMPQDVGQQIRDGIAQKTR